MNAVTGRIQCVDAAPGRHEKNGSLRALAPMTPRLARSSIEKLDA
jgi:hypothetical protein